MHDYFAERNKWYSVSKKLLAVYNDGSHSIKSPCGSVTWEKNGVIHRNEDKPAFINGNGTLAWYKNGEQHRLRGPAVIGANGTLYWYKNGKLHRDSGLPAYIGANGKLQWRKNGRKHRVSGPAIIHPNNKHEYWIDGVEITKEVKSWLKTRQYTYPFTPEQQVEFTFTFG
jgi:hypothetical protein